MIDSRASYTGHNVGMAELRAEHGIMPSRSERPHRQADGIVTRTHLKPVRNDPS